MSRYVSTAVVAQPTPFNQTVPVPAHVSLLKSFCLSYDRWFTQPAISRRVGGAGPRSYSRLLPVKMEFFLDTCSGSRQTILIAGDITYTKLSWDGLGCDVSGCSMTLQTCKHVYMHFKSPLLVGITHKFFGYHVNLMSDKLKTNECPNNAIVQTKWSLRQWLTLIPTASYFFQSWGNSFQNLT